MQTSQVMVCPTSDQWYPFQHMFDHCFCKVRCLWCNEFNMVRNLTSMRNELSKDRTHHLEESNARIRADSSNIRKLWEKQYQCIGRFDSSGHYATVLIIVSGTLTAATSVNVKNALQIGKACMAAYENKLPQGFYNKISSYVVTMDINMRAVTTVDIEVVFNRTLSIMSSEGFDLHDLFSHELAPIPTSLFLYNRPRRLQHSSFFKIKT